MRPFRCITVFIEWRCKAEGVPDDRLVRARVCLTETHAGGICRQWGEELIAPRKLTDSRMSEVHTICLRALHGLSDRVVFKYEVLMALPDESYPPAELEVA